MKRIILFGIILFLILPGITMADEKYEDYNLLLDIVEDLDGEVHEGDITFNGIIQQDFINEEDISKLGEKIKSDLNLSGKEIDPLILYDKLDEEFYTKEITIEKDFNQITYCGYDENKNAITIILSSYLDPDTLKGETYLCINIVKHSDFLEINDIIERIRYIFKAYDNPVQITSFLIGSLHGKIEADNMTNEVNNTLKNFKGEIIQEYLDGFSLSYAVYTPLIESYLVIEEKKINLNLAIRYNEYEDKTYILVGTPIIATGY